MTTFKTFSRLAPIVGLVAAATFVPVASVSANPGAPAASSSVQRIQAAPRIPDGAKATGAVAATAAVTGAVVLKPRDNSALTTFISAVTDKTSPQYHDYLDPGAFAGRFGPTASTIATVKATLESDGLHVTNVASDGLLMSFTGTAGHVESTFHTGLSHYRLANGAIGEATTSSVELPSSIAGARSPPSWA
jgi:kumamolisin